jgi:drug/metabolite transporter (DMT)-like permease
MSIVGILLAIAAAAFWAIGMTVAKPAVRHMDPVSFTIGRWGLVVVPLLMYGGTLGTINFPGSAPIAWACLAGFMDATLGGLFYLMAMQRAPAYQITTLAGTAPLWGVATALLFLSEPFTETVLVAGVLVVIGSYLLVGRRLRLDRTRAVGSLLALLTGFLWGFAETVPAKLALDQGLSPETFLLAFAAFGMTGMILLRPLLRRSFPRRITRRGWLYLAVSSLSTAFIGWLLWLNALRLAPASILSPIRGSSLLFAFLYSIIFLREQPTRRGVFGSLLVLAGVLFVSLG